MNDKLKHPGVATIKDVAAMANTSISTVSRIINKKGGVTEELEQRIKHAIEVLKYKPNTVARALKAKLTKSLGLIVPSVENAIFPILIRVIEDTAKKYGFSTILCNSDGDVEEEARYLQLLVEKQVDGIIFNAMGVFHEAFQLAKESDTPLIVLGKKVEGFSTANVTINNYQGAFDAVSYLIKSGMKDIAFLFGQLESSSAVSNRFQGYKDALADSGLEFREELIVKGGKSYEGGIAAVDELLSRKVRFDSLFASNDMMAIGSIDRLLDKGFKIPDDISVMGYDDIPVSQIIRPHLSTVHTPVNVLGAEAVKTILRIIYTRKDSLTEKSFMPELIIRDSTRKIINDKKPQ